MPLPKINPKELESLKDSHAVPRGDKNGEAESPHAQAGDGAVTAAGALIPSEVKTKAIAALDAALTATRLLWSKELTTYIEEADHATRVRAAELVLAYAEGRPVERKLTLTGSAGGGFDERIAQLCATPEGLRIAISLGIVAEESNDIRKDAKSQKAKSEKALQSLNKTEIDRSAVSQKRESRKANGASE